MNKGKNTTVKSVLEDCYFYPVKLLTLLRARKFDIIDVFERVIQNLTYKNFLFGKNSKKNHYK